MKVTTEPGSRARRRVVGAAIAILMGAASIGVAQQDPAKMEQRMKDLEAKNREILERLQAAEHRNVELEGRLATVSEDARRLSLEGSELEKMINAATADLADPITFTDLTRSGNPIRFYGHFMLHGYENTARLNSAVSPTFVLPEGAPAGETNDDSFVFDARLTRFGFDVNAGTIGEAKATGKLEIDFSNFPSGTAESRETPRIRLAWVDLDFGSWGLRFGQDWDVISPLMPSVDQQNLLWNTGNLGDRRPQAQIRWKTGDPKEFAFDIRASAGMQGAVDNSDADPAAAGVSAERDGFDAGHPHGQLRLGFQFPSWVENATISTGVWGYYGSFETDTKFGGDDDFDAYAAGLDLVLPLIGPLTLRGEIWIGQALGDMRGSIGQIFATNGPHVGNEIEAWGGWGELVFKATDAFTLHAGGGADNPSDGDVNSNAANFNSDGKTLNWVAYVGGVYDFGGGLKAGIDALYRETQYLQSGIGNGMRFDFWIQLSF